MRPVAADDPVALCVCQSVTRLRFAKAAERIEVLFVVETLENPRHIVLNGSSYAPSVGGSGGIR